MVLAQGMSDKLKGSETLAEHTSVNRENYAAMLSTVIKEFENGFQDSQKKSPIFWFICGPICSQHKYVACEFSNGI